MTDLSAFSLAGKRFVVTGANTGIGQGIAVAIAKAGGAVIGVGRSSMDETAALVKAEGAAFAPVTCDLGDHVAASAMLDGVWETAGPVDGLVNNAGIIRRADAVDFSEDRLGRRDGRQSEVAVLPLPGLRQEGAGRGAEGRIVNIASVLSFQGGIRVASYTASKHGVLGVTRAARLRVGGEGHQRQRHRAGLCGEQQHRGAAQRSRPQRRHPRPHSRRRAGASRRILATQPSSCSRRPPPTCMAR